MTRTDYVRRRDPGRAARARSRASSASPSLIRAPDRDAIAEPSPARHRRPGRIARASSGHPVSVSPLTARTQADRDLVALVFSGLVRNGPNGTIVPGPGRSSWTVDPTGTIWTFHLRPDARWHDGEPVTADDVVFTIRSLQDPAYTGPAAGVVERGLASRPTVAADRHVHPDARRWAGSCRPRPSRSPRRTCWPRSRSTGWPDDPFGRQPVGSGPFAVASLDDDARRAHPGRDHPRRRTRRPPTRRPMATDSLADRRPDRSARAGPSRTWPGSTSVLRRRRALVAAVSRRATSTRRPACRRR